MLLILTTILCLNRAIELPFNVSNISNIDFNLSNPSTLGNLDAVSTLLILGQFYELEKRNNVTADEVIKDIDFGKELWENTNAIIKQNYNQTSSQYFYNLSRFDFISNNLTNISETYEYLQEFSQNSDQNKSIILQYIIKELMEESEQNFTSDVITEEFLIKTENITNILLENEKNKDNDEYIQPVEWIHTNVTTQESYLSNVIYKLFTEKQNLEDYLDNLTVLQKFELLTSLTNYLQQQKINKDVPVETDSEKNSDGIEPEVDVGEQPVVTNETNTDSDLYIVLFGTILAILLIIGAIYYFRRQKLIKLLPFQNEGERTVSGF